MPSKKPDNQEYSAKNIVSMTPREHVRRRPGMYIGGTGKQAFHHLLWEVVDNAVDEAMAGRCTEIKIVLHSDTRVSVIDNGTGIPVEIYEDGVNHFEIIMTQIWTGKFNEGAYKVSGGLHGLGIASINFLSSEMLAEVKWNGNLWRQSYREGIAVTGVEQIRSLAEGESTGTSITFTPDFTIMDEGLAFDYALIVERCQELAYLLPGIKFSIEDEAGRNENLVLNQGNGLVDWVNELSIYP